VGPAHKHNHTGPAVGRSREGVFWGDWGGGRDIGGLDRGIEELNPEEDESRNTDSNNATKTHHEPAPTKVKKPPTPPKRNQPEKKVVRKPTFPNGVGQKKVLKKNVRTKSLEPSPSTGQMLRDRLAEEGRKLGRGRIRAPRRGPVALRKKRSHEQVYSKKTPKETGTKKLHGKAGKVRGEAELTTGRKKGDNQPGARFVCSTKRGSQTNAQRRAPWSLNARPSSTKKTLQ